MDGSDLHVFPGTAAAERGLPPLDLRFRIGPALTILDVEPGDPSGAVLAGEERGTADRLIGRIELGLFSASLIIDRAGVVEEAARRAAQTFLAGPARARLLGEGEVELASGVVGYRIDVLLQLDENGGFRPSCPYASWLALISGDAVAPGGALVTVRSAAPAWAAAAALLDSLEIGGAARPAANAAGLPLPLVRLR